MMGSVDTICWNGKNVYRLACGRTAVLAAPEDGMNLYQIGCDGKEVIRFMEEKYARKATYSVPILYPTPNRSADLKIQVGDRTFEARMHGLVKNLPFEVLEAAADDESARLTGCLSWDEGQKDYGMFPFPSKLYITVVVKDHEVAWNYRVCNLGDGVLPYGIAIHPYFDKRGQKVWFTVPAQSVMEMTEEKLPTGKLIPVAGTAMDLGLGAKADALSLDHVFTDLKQGEPVEIHYEDLTVKLVTSEEFSHVVVFTPEADFFCIENQSCSTDCFNMYAKGFARESGLEFVQPGEKKEGFIHFAFSGE